MCDEDTWSEADNAKLQLLCDVAREAIEWRMNEMVDAGPDNFQAMEEALAKCTVANAAREVVKFAICELDCGISDHYIRPGVRDGGGAAGRLIVYGFAHGIYPGFPGSREFEWEYALTGFEAINPDYF